MSLPVVNLMKLKHRGDNQIGIYFKWDYELIKLVRSVDDARWSSTQKCWYVKNKPDNLRSIFVTLKEKAIIDSTEFFRKKITKAEPKPLNKRIPTKLNVEAKKSFEEYENFLNAERLRPNTIKTYLSLIESFFSWFYHKSPNEISNDEVNKFCKDYLVKREYSPKTQMQMISAIKKYYSSMADTVLDIEKLPSPRTNKTLLKFLSHEEISRILTVTTNNKHWLIIMLLFACGLRKSEPSNILLSDIYRDSNLILIKDAKGRKDRLVPLSGKLLKQMEIYYKEYKPKRYLFEGQSKEKYSAESVYNAVKKAGVKAKLTRPIAPHMLRHSYGTQQTENGISALILQKIMGHKSSKTTEIYAHISQKQIGKTASPIDNMEF